MATRHPCPTPSPSAHRAAGGRRPAAHAVGPPEVPPGRRCPSCSANTPSTVIETEAPASLADASTPPTRARVQRRHGGRRGRKRGRPVAHDAGPAAVEDLLEAANDAPIIRMLNALLTQAAKDGASDIHIEPYERGAGALPRRRHAARGGATQQGAARRADLAPEDHGRARHRREAPAAGRPHQLRIGGAPSTCAFHPAHGHGERAVLRLLDKGESKFTLEGLGMERRRADALRPPDPAAARHRARHRPHRLGQDDHAVRRAGPWTPPRQQRADGRGPGRVRTARHRPDAGQRQDRPHLSPRRCAPSCARTRTSS